MSKLVRVKILALPAYYFEFNPHLATKEINAVIVDNAAQNFELTGISHAPYHDQISVIMTFQERDPE